MGLKYNAAFDGLRALAAVSVLLFHTGVPGFAGGVRGVDAFFVLSGFLITSLLRDEITTTGRVRVERFWTRRLRRLAPALVLMLAVYVAASALLYVPEKRASIVEVLAALFYATDLFAPMAPKLTPLTHTWSLAVEMQFYLVWPLILPRLIKTGRAAPILLGVWLAMTALRWAWPTFASPAVYFSPLHITGLLLGSALALSPVQPRGGLGALMALGVVAFAGAVGKDVWAAPLTELATAALIPSLASRGAVAQRLLGWRPLARLGLLSYGMYLWHEPVAWAIPDGAPWRPAVTLLVATGLSGLSYMTIERRFLRSNASVGHAIA